MKLHVPPAESLQAPQAIRRDEKACAEVPGIFLDTAPDRGLE